MDAVLYRRYGKDRHYLFYSPNLVVQALEYIRPEQQATLVRELNAYILRCVKDSNGNHVGAS